MFQWLRQLRKPVVKAVEVEAPISWREPNQPDGQSCKNCRFISDYSDTEPYDECNAYCTHDFVMGVKDNEYGGHWTHTESWCSQWQQGPSKWQRIGPGRSFRPEPPK